MIVRADPPGGLLTREVDLVGSHVLRVVKYAWRSHTLTPPPPPPPPPPSLAVSNKLAPEVDFPTGDAVRVMSSRRSECDSTGSFPVSRNGSSTPAGFKSPARVADPSRKAEFTNLTAILTRDLKQETSMQRLQASRLPPSSLHLSPTRVRFSR